MSQRFLNITLVLLCVSVLAVSTFLTLWQANYVRKLNNEWSLVSSENTRHALTLTALERAFGYVGFIHHFKNYVLRRKESDYISATESYWEANDALLNLLLSDLSETEMREILTVQDTLNEYFRKLNRAKIEYDVLPAEELDILVRVNDEPARQALVTLRKSLLPQISDQFRENKASNDNNTLLMALGVFFPVSIIVLLAIGISLITRKLLVRAGESDALIAATPDGFFCSDIQGKILKTNKAAVAIFGYSQSELLTMTIEDLIDEDIKAKHQLLRKNFIRSHGSRLMRSETVDICGVTKSGGRVPLSIAISAQKDHVIAIVRDITEYKRLEAESTHDGLTKLLNHRTVSARLDDEVKRAKRYSRQLSVLLVDVDRFKNLNDNEGHLAGDKGLIMVAEHLTSELRKHDHIGRWGGDEFLVVCPELASEHALELADRIRRRFADLHFPWVEPLTLSIGIASFHDSQVFTHKQNLFEEADIALYHAKERGRNQQIHYDAINRPRQVN